MEREGGRGEIERGGGGATQLNRYHVDGERGWGERGGRERERERERERKV